MEWRQNPRMWMWHWPGLAVVKKHHCPSAVLNADNRVLDTVRIWLNPNYSSTTALKKDFAETVCLVNQHPDCPCASATAEGLVTAQIRAAWPGCLTAMQGHLIIPACATCHGGRAVPWDNPVHPAAAVVALTLPTSCRSIGPMHAVLGAGSWEKAAEHSSGLVPKASLLCAPIYPAGHMII